MMKIVLIISFLVSPIFSEEESELNKFEESLKEEKINSSDTNSNTNESQSNHTNQNLNNRNCSHSYCYNYCTHSYKKKERKSSLSERIESFFEFKLKIGPCTDKLYAVLPAGVETKAPSEINLLIIVLAPV